MDKQFKNLFNNSEDNERNSFLKNLESNVVDKKASLEHYNEIINKNNK